MFDIMFKLYIFTISKCISTTFHHSTQGQALAPTAKGVNALEIWMLWCLIMVFAALCEYGMILLIKRRSIAARHHEKQQRERTCSEEHLTNMDGTIFDNTTPSNAGKNNRRLFVVCPNEGKAQGTAQQVAHLCSTDDTTNLSLKLLKIDSAALVIFPIVFAVFVVIYCIIFTK